MYGFNKVPVLSAGGHVSPEEGMCIMELVSFINSEPFSDTPDCTDPHIALYMQNVNDTTTDEERAKLLSVIDRMFHTGDMTWGQREDFSAGLRNLWPELAGMFEEERTQVNYGFRDEIISNVHAVDPAVFLELWRFLHDLSMSEESVDVKLAVLNKVLDVMDEAMGVEETLPQNREEIEKMLAGVQG